MPTFSYIARDRAGQKNTGLVAAKDEVEVRQILRSKELFVTNVIEQASNASSVGQIVLFKKKSVSLKEMVVMSRQLATLVRAGISIVESLQSVEEQSGNLFLKETLATVRLDIMKGSTLTDAMKKHPKVFNETYIALASAGETGGVLERTLEIAGHQMDQEAELQEKVKAAFVYPLIVLVASLGVVVFMLVFIVPVFAKVYQQFHATLPPVTQLLIVLSDILLRWWWIVVLTSYGAIMGFKAYVKTDKGKRHLDILKLKAPLLGGLNRKIAVARFTQTFAGAVKAGVPILRALSISAQTSGNVIIIEAIKRVINFVKEGSTLAVPLEQCGEFPPMVTRMIAAGEHSGNLDSMLEEVTRFYERDIQYTVDRLTKMMEPAMTVVVGGIVLFVLLALYMPIFNLTNVVRSK